MPLVHLSRIPECSDNNPGPDLEKDSGIPELSRKRVQHGVTVTTTLLHACVSFHSVGSARCFLLNITSQQDAVAERD